MTRSSSAFIALITACALPAFAQHCSLSPGSVGLGNYCGTGSQSDQKVAISTQAAGNNPAGIDAAAPTSKTKEQAPTGAQPGKQGQTQRWTILPTDGKLAVTFERWTAAAGMKLIWDAQQHVMHSSADTYEGTLEQALARVLSSSAIRLSAYPLEACVYPNNPPVLRVTRLGDQKECQQ